MRGYFMVAGALLALQLRAGGPIDSLNKLISAAAQDTHRVMLLNEISDKYRSVAKYDEALQAVQEARALSAKLDFKRGYSGALANFSTIYTEKGDLKIALAYIDSAIQINEKNNYILPLVHNYQSKGYIMEETGDLSGGLDCELRALQLIEQHKLPDDVLSPALINMGNVYLKNGLLPKALDYYLRALKLCGEDDNRGDVGIMFNNMAGIYTRQGDYDKAIYYTQKSLKIRQRKNDKKGVSGSYNNLGNIFGMKHDYVMALDYLNKALTIRKELGLKKGMASTYAGIGGVYHDLKQYDNAEKMYTLSLRLYDSIGSKEGVIDDLVSLSSVHLSTKKYDKAIQEGLQALKMAREGNYMEYIISANQNLSAAYTATHDWEKALMHYQDFVSTRDTMYNKEKTSEIVQSQMNYDFEKKEAAAKAEQEKKDALAEKDRQREKLMRNIFLGGFVLILFFALFIFRNYRQKQKANLLLEIQKKEIQMQKEIVEDKNKEILDSIHYAKRIQNSLLPTEKYIERNLNKGLKKDRS